jgi:hypothetical protein
MAPRPRHMWGRICGGARRRTHGIVGWGRGSAGPGAREGVRFGLLSLLSTPSPPTPFAHSGDIHAEWPWAGGSPRTHRLTPRTPRAVHRPGGRGGVWGEGRRQREKFRERQRQSEFQKERERDRQTDRQTHTEGGGPSEASVRPVLRLVEQGLPPGLPQRGWAWASARAWSGPGPQGRRGKGQASHLAVPCARPQVVCRPPRCLAPALRPGLHLEPNRAPAQGEAPTWGTRLTSSTAGLEHPEHAGTYRPVSHVTGVGPRPGGKKRTGGLGTHGRASSCGGTGPSSEPSLSGSRGGGSVDSVCPGDAVGRICDPEGAGDSCSSFLPLQLPGPFQSMLTEGLQSLGQLQLQLHAQPQLPPTPWPLDPRADLHVAPQPAPAQHLSPTALGRSLPFACSTTPPPWCCSPSSSPSWLTSM